MNEVKNESKPKLNRNTDRLPIPQQFRRIERARKNRDHKRRNDGAKLGSGGFSIGFSFWGAGAIYTPPRKKHKGWQRENRRHRKAA